MTEVHFFCVLCGHGLAIGEHEGGGVCVCPHCRRSIPVPSASADTGKWADVFPPEVLSVDVKFACPRCATILESDVRHGGMDTVCPQCALALTVPALGFAEAAVAISRGTHLTQAEIDFLSGPKADGT